MSLDSLHAADRGFLTLVASRLRESVDELWSSVCERSQTRVEGDRITVLDLSLLGPRLRWAVGETAHLSLPFAGLDGVRTLDVSGLQLDGLDVRGLPALEVLRCGDNRLKELSLDQAEVLEQLDVCGNDLMVLDLRGLMALRVVDASGNSLAALMLDAGQRLRQLDVSRNQLMVLDLPSLPDLEELLAYRNALMQASLGALPKLQRLDLGRNDLETLNLPSLPSLTHLSLDRNRLAELDLGSTPRLTHVKLFANYLAALDASGLAELVELDARGNQLTHLDLSSAARLAELDVADNRLESLLLPHSDALLALRCAGNELRGLALDRVSGVCQLHVSDNALTHLDLSSAGALAELKVDGNPLRRLDITACVELCRLTTRGDRGDAVDHIEASDVQRHRLRELRERFGLTTGASRPAEMDRWELHDYAVACEGRRDVEDLLLEVVTQPHCDLGTALMVYWSSSPHYYLRYATREECEPYERPGWDLVRTVEERVAAGLYMSQEIWFDPTNDKQTRSVTGHDWTRDATLTRAEPKRSIPAAMHAPSLA